MLTARARIGTWREAVFVLVALGAAGLSLDDRLVFALGVAAAYAIAAIGVDISSGYAAQPIFGQSGFMALGAYISTLLMVHFGLPFLVATALAIAVSMLIAHILGAAAVRLSHLGFAIVTITFAYVIVVLLNGRIMSPITNGASGLSVPTGTVVGAHLNTSHGFFWGAFTLLVVSLAVSRLYIGSNFGRTLITIKQSEIVAAAMGMDVHKAKLRAFRIASGLGALAGALLAQAVGFISPESFAPLLSVTVFAMAAVGGLGTITGAVIGAVFFRLIPQLSRGLGEVDSIVFAGLFLASLIAFPEGLFGIIESVARRFGGGDQPTGEDVREDEGSHLSSREREAPLDSEPLRLEQRSSVLSVSDVSVHFGGVRALHDVSMTVLQGTVHALLGPNGAGKTTLLNCISGIQEPTSGSIVFNGGDVTQSSPQVLRRLGMARTFQHPSLVPDLSVLDNVRIGTMTGPAEREGPVADIRRLLSARPDVKGTAAAQEALESVAIPRARWTVNAAELSMGEQKLVDLARAVAGEADVILLDEPGAGLGSSDLDTVTRALRTLRRTRELSIILVSHQVNFVRRLADEVTVLEFGEVVAKGRPEAVVRNPKVVDAFLGAEVTDVE